MVSEEELSKVKIYMEARGMSLVTSEEVSRDVKIPIDTAITALHLLHYKMLHDIKSGRCYYVHPKF